MLLSSAPEAGPESTNEIGASAMGRQVAPYVQRVGVTFAFLPAHLVAGLDDGDTLRWTEAATATEPAVHASARATRVATGGCV